MVTLWGRRWTRPGLLARVGRLEQVAGMRLVEAETGPNGAGWPAGTRDLLSAQLRTPEEVSDGQR